MKKKANRLDAIKMIISSKDGFRAVFAFLGECPHGQQRQQEDEIEDVDVKDRGERKRIGR